MKQWMDRQVYANKAVLSRATASTLRDGPGNHVWQFPTDSMLSIADDGADQAKFKTPHATGTKVHALAKFPRLPIHVQGLWAHGFGLQIALGSVDIPKDSFTNIEMLSRLLDSILTKYGSLPINLALQQDNCPRDCKTQTMMKWCATLVLHKIFRTCSLDYLGKGHTHIDLDSVFGQLAVKLVQQDWDDVDELVEILLRVLANGASDPGTKEHTLAYKLEEVANWKAVIDNVGISIQGHGGGNAPHVFTFFLRSDLDMVCGSGRRPEFQEFPSNVAKNRDDVCMLVRHSMSSKDISQLIALVPAAMRLRTRTLQPMGSMPKKTKDPELVKLIFSQCAMASRQKLISPRAQAYLEGWASDTLKTEPRPERYLYLEHRWDNRRPDAVREHIPYDGLSFRPNVIKIKYAKDTTRHAAVDPAADGDPDVLGNGEPDVEVVRVENAT